MVVTFVLGACSGTHFNLDVTIATMLTESFGCVLSAGVGFNRSFAYPDYEIIRSALAVDPSAWASPPRSW